MSRVFTAGPIDFEEIGELIRYRTRMHESLRRKDHEPVDQYTELLQTLTDEDITTAADLMTAAITVENLPDEPFARIIEHAVTEASWEEIVESPERIPKYSTMEHIEKLIERDMELLCSSAGVVAYLPRPSCGTMVELVRAYDSGRPIVVISDSPPHYPQYFADAIEPTIESGIDRLAELLNDADHS